MAGSAPAPSQVERIGEQFGLSARALTAEETARLQLRGGVVVEGADGAAARAGLQRGDVILSINQRPVTTPAEAAAAVAAARQAGRDTVLLLVQRGTGPTRFVGVKLNSNQR